MCENEMGQVVEDKFCDNIGEKPDERKIKCKCEDDPGKGIIFSWEQFWSERKNSTTSFSSHFLYFVLTFFIACVMIFLLVSKKL